MYIFHIWLARTEVFVKFHCAKQIRKQSKPKINFSWLFQHDKKEKPKSQSSVTGKKKKKKKSMPWSCGSIQEPKALS